ncbi:MAG TPA: cyanophycinase [Thermoanaerobaculia bacterium]|nr:cyanophycinase [Thermoanaerobaculia bacterium]
MIKGSGCVMAIGGNEDKRGSRSSLLATFVRRAGGDAARIVIIPSASVEPVRRAAQYTRLFRRLGAQCVITVHTERGATPDELLLIENATGIFVTGGDQLQLMQHLRRTGAAASIVNAVRNGAVYAGTSAGAAAVSQRMLYGHTLENGHEVVKFAEGLGLVPGVIVDQHFSQRQRLPRLTHAVETYGLVGVGIDENTATIWEGGTTVTVCGAGGVTLVQPGRDDVHVATSGETLPL